MLPIRAGSSFLIAFFIITNEQKVENCWLRRKRIERLTVLEEVSKMYLLVDVLEHTEHLSTILEKFAKIGVSGTTALDSTGMGRMLLESHADVPVAKTIAKVVAGHQPTNKTLFAVIEEEETLKKAIEAIKSICGDLNKPGKGILFTISLDSVEGLNK
jgi:nitrogen regulatory protein PII